MNNKTTFADIKLKQIVKINHLNGSDKDWLLEMGIVPGNEISKLYEAPFGGPIICDINGSRVTLRRSQASSIVVSI